jgi:hypothetical protein
VPKILSEENKKDMINDFKLGKSFNELSIKYSLKEITIRKHLKKLLTKKEFDETEKNLKEKTFNLVESYTSDNIDIENHNLDKNQEFFYEISPLNEEIDFNVRKDLTSKPLKEFDLPNNIYMIVNANVDLEIKYIKDFPEYSFLSEDDQNCKTIKLFSDKKLAKQVCSKSNKLLKVPNGEVFKLSTSFLLKKGITRIIFDDYLLSI